MNDCRSFLAACCAALARAAHLAAVTLSIVNIYPTVSFSQETGETGDGEPSISVDMLFDFEVPVSVISNGVSDALIAPSDLPDPDPTTLMVNLSDTIDHTAALEQRGVRYGNSTYSFTLPNGSTNQYSPWVLRAAREDQSGKIFNGSQSAILGTLNVSSLNSIPTTLLGVIPLRPYLWEQLTQ